MRFSYWAPALAGMLAAAAAHSARADHPLDLLQITSDTSPGTNVFSLVLDDSGDVLGSQYPNLPFFPLSALRAGVVLKHNDRPSLDVVKLSADANFDAKDGGRIHIYFMGSAFKPHSYGDLPLDIQRNGATWTAYSLNTDGSRKTPVSHLHFVANYSSLLHRVIGVSYVNAW